MKNVTRKALGFGMAAVMLASGSAVPASAVGAQQEAVVSASFAEQLGALAKPQIVKTKAGPGAVKLTWKKVDRATGYKIFMKTASGWKCKVVVKGGAKLSAKVQGLDSKTEYVFKVQAYKKTKKKTYYSKFSTPLAVKTAYGLGKNNYSCKKFSIRFNSKTWSAMELGDGSISIAFNGNKDVPANTVGALIMSGDRPDEYKGMTIEQYIESEEFQKDMADNPNAEFVGYTTIDGYKFAMIDVTEDGSFIHELLGFTDKSIYAMITAYDKTNDASLRLLNAQLKKMDIKK